LEKLYIHFLILLILIPDISHFWHFLYLCKASLNSLFFLSYKKTLLMMIYAPFILFIYLVPPRHSI
jgi:hypothetical protein